MKKGKCSLFASSVLSRYFEQSGIYTRQASELASTKVDEKPSRLENKRNCQCHAGGYYIVQYVSLLFIFARALMRPSIRCPQYYDYHALQYLSLLLIHARALIHQSLGCPQYCDNQIWLRLNASKLLCFRRIFLSSIYHAPIS